MKKKQVVYTIAFLMILVVIVWGMSRTTTHIGKDTSQKTMEQLEQSIRRATISCYANEGVYPPDLSYLKEHYGIQINESAYTVFYEIQGDNMMPDITVMENQSP